MAGLVVLGGLLPSVSGTNMVGSEGRLPMKMAAAVGSAAELDRTGFEKPNFSYIPYWEVSSVSGEYWEAGRWHDGPQGTGPATLTFAQEIRVSNTAFGQVEVGDGVLTSSVGYDVGVSYAQEAAYTINIPSGMTEEIVWHAWYHQNTVDEQEVLPPRSIVVGTATCYTREFSHFGYRTRVLSG